MNLILSTLRTVIKAYPAIVPHLKGRARWVAFMYYKGTPDIFENKNAIGDLAYAMAMNSTQEAARAVGLDVKTYDYFLSTLERLVQSVYDGNLSGEFIDILANLISGQLTQAYEAAWKDEGDESEFPDYLTASLEDMILGQYDHVDSFYRAIVDARIDETPVDPLLSRSTQWAGQFDTAYKEAVQLIHIESGGNLVWRKGETERGCSTCAALDGITMSAREWQELDVYPRGYPNNKLECEGGGPANNCDCTLEPTEQRRTAGAYNTVMNIVSK